MPNAISICEHYGDDGLAPIGRVMLDMDDHRFAELEKRQLVREATATEVAKAKAEPEAPDAQGDDHPAKAARASANKAAPKPANK